MTCPICNSPDIRVSQHPHWNDVFQRMVGRQAYRCRKCRNRFYASDSFVPIIGKTGRTNRARGISGHVSTRQRRRLVGRLIVVAIFVVMFALFLLYLRYLTTDRPQSEDSRTTWILSASSNAQGT